MLERHQMQNIPFARPTSQADAKIFLRKYKKIIAKPVKGRGAYDINIVTTSAQLQTLDVTKYILEKYIAGSEVRYLVLNNEVIGVYRSDYGTSVEVTRPMQCITYPETAWDPALVSSAISVASTLDLGFAAVDYIIESSGQAYILEVNTTPDLGWFHAPSAGPTVDVASKFLTAIFSDVATKMPDSKIEHEEQSTLAYS
jgi:D-alanine-D-alanine ligase-like ATP-grasp enzyme